MNSIKNYFQSPIKENINSTIIENMTAVVKSGKKKRKRKKNKDNNESVISDISQTLSCSLHFESDSNILNVSNECIEMTSPEQLDNTADKKSKVKNVFEVMMDARNRVIGSNSNGIVLDTEPVNQETTPTSVKNKRKLILEKWCEQKGKTERLVKEEAELEFINKKMYKRAERLKKLLTNNSSEVNNIDEDKIENSKKKTKIMAKKKLEMDDEVENETTSPSNKRDILGYFPKLNGSLGEKNENIRPRRSCAKNKSYIFDLSPEKKENSLSPTTTPSKRTKRSSNRSPNIKSKKQKLVSDDEVEFTSCQIGKPKKQPKVESKNIKLAPLFVKQVPKPAIDPEILKARHEFLMSGIPDSMRLEMARQKNFDDEFELNYSYFPEISHITQLYSKSIQNGNGKIVFKAKNCTELDVVLNYNKLKFGVITNCVSNPKVLNFSNVNGQLETQKIPRKNLITLIKNLESDGNNYPVYRCYKQLKLKCSERIDKTSENDVQIINDISFQNRNQLFNEKFKPKCLNEIYINYRQGVELKHFLSNWQEYYYNHKLSEESLSNSVSSMNSTPNFVVLIGPHGSGKTNSVYAMAQEMNFKVLEINCGSKRTGKKMLQKLHEATQSHNVHQHTNSQKIEDTDSRSDTDINTKKLALVLIEDSDIVFEQDDGFINAINQLISTSKRPVVLISNTLHSNHLLKFIEQNSIIYDAPSLINVAKYISLLGLVEHCFLDYGELGKLIQHNKNDLRRTINMVQFFILSGGDRDITSYSNKDKSVITKIPDTFGLSEMLDVDDDNSKFSWYNSDDEQTISKRKSSTVQIHRHIKIFEFFIKNQNYSSKFQFYGDFDNLWLNLPKIFLVKHDSNIKAKKKSKKSVKIKITDTLNQISNFYDSISVALVLDAEKSNHDFSFSCDLSKEIVSTIVEYSLEQNNVDYNNYNILLNNNHDSLDLLYNNLSSTLGSSTAVRRVSTQSVSLDYEPYLRSMCRSEKGRQHNTDRRSTRFYHYLRNSINTCNFGTEYFDRHANVLNDQFD